MAPASIWRTRINSSAHSNACTQRVNFPAPASDWRPSSASSIGMAGASGQTRNPKKARLFISHSECFRRREQIKWETTMKTKKILLVEDSPDDQELIRMAFEDGHIANEFIALSDGAQALDYLF